MSLGFHKVMETLVWLRDAGQTHPWSPGRLWNSDRQEVPAKPFIALHRWLHTVGALWRGGGQEEKVRLLLLAASYQRQL